MIHYFLATLIFLVSFSISPAQAKQGGFYFSVEVGLIEMLRMGMSRDQNAFLLKTCQKMHDNNESRRLLYHKGGVMGGLLGAQKGKVAIKELLNKVGQANGCAAGTPVEAKASNATSFSSGGLNQIGCTFQISCD